MTTAVMGSMINNVTSDRQLSTKKLEKNNQMEIMGLKSKITKF